MDTRTYTRAVAFIAWRVTQAMVIFPAAAVGVFLAVMALAGQRPVEGTLESIFHYAETNIRPARQGHVLVVDCVAPAETSGLTKPTVICDATAPREVAVARAIASTMETLQHLYWVLVILSFAALLMAMPDRRKLLGLATPINASAETERSV